MRKKINHLPTIALITNDTIGKNMAGPGIRYWELARVLGQQFPVNLIIPPYLKQTEAPDDADLPATIHLCPTEQRLRQVVAQSDVIITLGLVLATYPFLKTINKPLVLDMYDPYLLANLARDSNAPWPQQLQLAQHYLQTLTLQLQHGDFFLCAGEKQRDYWLGMLSAVGRLNPYTYRQDPSLRQLIDVVPFGLPPQPPQQTQAVLKGVYKTIALNDKVILWGGGIWNWFDAPTMIKAMPLILAHRPEVKLFFMGIKRPNQSRVKMTAVEEAIALAQHLGLENKAVFFNEWVAYDMRQNYLLEADLGVSLHLAHIETRFAFRTRLLDYLWAGLPTVATEGDVLGEMMAAQQLAHLVAPQDVAGVVETILTLLDKSTLRTDYTTHFRQIASSYTWEAISEPLQCFCAQPYFAPDKAYLNQQRTLKGRLQGWGGLTPKIKRALQQGGPRNLLHQSLAYLRWRLK